MKTYKVVKQAVSTEIADFAYQYFLNKRKVARHLFDSKYISPFTEYWGVWNDTQVPETYSHYSDLVMETLLQKMKPIMEKETEKTVVETYSYARIYKKGDELKRHKDRPSCETSCTMNLGGDEWPIFLEPSGAQGKEGVKVLLNPGDMLIYRGCDLEHWREPFEGSNNAQVFLHYNNKSEPNARAEKFDRRIHLGLPAWFKGKIVQDFK